jgi:hypothetical protein
MASKIELANQASESPARPTASALETSAHGSSRRRKWSRLRLILAMLFAAATILYSAIWMYYIRKPSQAALGLEDRAELSQRYLAVIRVEPGGPADRAGLQAGDRIVSLDGKPFRTIEPIYTARVLGRPGDTVTLGVQKAGSGPTLNVPVVLEKATPSRYPQTPWQRFIGFLLNSFPVPFVLVGLSVLFLRIDDRNAWLLALLFAGLIASAPMMQMVGIIPPSLRRFTLTYLIAIFPLVPASLYYLFAIFPTRTPVDLRFPWLKYLLLFGAASFSLPVACVALAKGGVDPIWLILDRVPQPFGAYLLVRI